jgi:maltose O-acetyltransferase
MRDLKRKTHYRLYRYISNIIEFGSDFERYKKFNHNAYVHPSVKLMPNATIENLSGNAHLINIGENSVIRGELLIFAHAGKIEIGKDCYLGEDSRIWSADSIKIGNRVLISHNVNIHDTNSHSLNSVLRHKHFIKLMSEGHPIVNDVDINSKAIIIEDDVWVGFNSTILKGVRIGKGAVVAACSIVTKDVPELVIVAGNPAKVIKKI